MNLHLILYPFDKLGSVGNKASISYPIIQALVPTTKGVKTLKVKLRSDCISVCIKCIYVIWIGQ